MDSANLYEQLDTTAYQPSFAAQSTHGIASIHEWYHPTLQNLNTDEYNRYMNENQLPKSWKPNFVDMGYKYYESCESPSSTNNTQISAVDLNQNLWLTNSSLSSSNQQVCLQGRRDNSNNQMLNNCVPWSSSTMGMGLMSTSNSQYSTHNKGLNLGMDFSSYLNNGDHNCSHSSNKEISPSFSNYDSCYSPSSTGSNKTLASRNEATNPGKKRVSTSSQKRPSQKAAVKKPKAAVSQSSSQLPKVGKEKIGDRIAALHKLVAPFGKTDTATVLTEANGYIHFLQHQIQTLSMPCEKPSRRRSDVRRFFEEMKQDDQEELDLEAMQDLKSRGLCLVPLSFASYVGLESMISW